ncbi:MAG TPA: cytochrome c biogenesis protein CcsA [Polyangiaceae bacterium]|jgi:heme exporter protein C|nr:cytochrome c biogenesis protein CcsA [Polyangiaceae bacterium]HNZ23187.1 cytochrome c biogenesis protein CcsA [Polyangiaceae bacterium]HOE49777.1 cytochrome c biogenesis protein CcsA [Polyangiaceae bacterium]HOH00745.1 cytochrome c biogenesis protein CcsA [Polyangiaceae bacterium]HOR34347.1 cytochrome c biogenesis protein CcsA [Polyangiaceae bacterium]
MKSCASARSSARLLDIAFVSLLTLATLGVLITVHLIFLRTPVEAQMGIVQKIFYFHVPSAYAMYLGATACFLGSTAYLFRISDRRDALARAGAEVAVAFGAVVLATGPLWAVKAWGHYWTWEPRLTTSLLSVLVYVAYLLLRSFGGGGEGERKFAATLGFLGALNLPLIHFSVRKWSGQHPEVVTGQGGGLQHVDMRITFIIAMLTFTFLAGTLLWFRFRLWSTEARLRRLEKEALEFNVGEES